MQVEKEMPGLSDLYDLNTAEGVEELSVAIEKVFSDAWFVHSEEYIITPRSKKWWTDECQKAYDEWKADDSAETRGAF